jgi:hypothetical protein
MSVDECFDPKKSQEKGYTRPDIHETLDDALSQRTNFVDARATTAGRGEILFCQRGVINSPELNM